MRRRRNSVYFVACGIDLYDIATQFFGYSLIDLKSGTCNTWNPVQNTIFRSHDCPLCRQSALIASCIDWAQHRRRKAAAKLHVRLDLHSLLPRFVLVESAKAADSIRAAEVCAGVKSGEIIIFDRAYVDFMHLAVLNDDGGLLGDPQ
jgi:hypothetical protein